MYEQWLLRRWDTPLSDAKGLFMESLHDHSGILEIELADYSNNAATARYKVRFRNIPLIETSMKVTAWNCGRGVSSRTLRLRKAGL